MFFDFETLAAPQAITTTLETDCPESRFALRFAALLEAEPNARFDNSAFAQLAREIFGASAGQARAAYDAAEAGFNVYLNRVGLDLSDIPAQ